MKVDYSMLTTKLNKAMNFPNWEKIVPFLAILVLVAANPPAGTKKIYKKETINELIKERMNEWKKPSKERRKEKEEKEKRNKQLIEKKGRK